MLVFYRPRRRISNIEHRMLNDEGNGNDDDNETERPITRTITRTRTIPMGGGRALAQSKSR